MLTNTISGILISLAFYNRIVYIPIVIIFLHFKPKLMFGFIAGIILMSLLINPIPFFENNIKMFHYPKYILDYSLLFVLPVMLYFNDKNFINIKKKYCKHIVLKKYKGYFYKDGINYYSFYCVNCKKEIIKEVSIYD